MRARLTHSRCNRDTEGTPTQPQALTGRSPRAVHGVPADNPPGSGFRRGRLLPGFPGRFSLHSQSRAASHRCLCQPARERCISATAPAVCSGMLARRSAPRRQSNRGRHPDSSRSCRAAQPERGVYARKAGVGSGGVAWHAANGLGGPEGSWRSPQRRCWPSQTCCPSGHCYGSEQGAGRHSRRFQWSTAAACGSSTLYGLHAQVLLRLNHCML